MPYSYNEYVQHRQSLRRLVAPGPLYSLAEATFAGLVLLLLNLSNIEGHLVSDIPGADKTAFVNPVDYMPQLVGSLSDTLSQYAWASRATLFIVWALLGMLTYILVFRAVQITNRTTRSLKQGWLYVRREDATGLSKWLGQLHDFMVKFLIRSGGLILITLGVFLVFTYANFQLQIGFSGTYDMPLPLISLLVGLVAAVIGMRVLVLGLCLIFSRFRRWYFIQ